MRVLFALLATLALTGCGLQPLYSGGGNAAIAQGLSSVQVSDIPGRGGWLLRGALEDRLGIAGATTPRYRLDVRIDDALEGWASSTMIRSVVSGGFCARAIS